MVAGVGGSATSEVQPPIVAPDAPFRKSIAIVIGINRYANGIPPLRSAANDARRLAQLLADEHGYQVQLLIDQEASGAALRRLFAETLPGQVADDDRLLIYFAGHGIALDSDGGPAGFLAPQDARSDDTQGASLIAMAAFQQELSKLRCRHLLLILDCCFAGAFRWAAATRDSALSRRTLYRERYERFVHDRAWQVLTSAAADQRAIDVMSRFGDRADNGEHSPFALALFEALRRDDPAGTAHVEGPPRDDGVLTVTELFNFVRTTVDRGKPDDPQRQTPMLWPLPQHDKGEFVFLVPGGVLNLPPAPDLKPENNPYRGLLPFTEEYAGLFFGRAATGSLLKMYVDARPLTVLTGASGAGKTSLLCAGLLPLLRNDPSGQRWHILGPLTLGAAPLRTLAKLPLPQAPRRLSTRPLRLLGSGRSPRLAERVRAWAEANPGARLLLAIDQAEELAAPALDRERDQALAELHEALVANPESLRVVIAVRASAEPQLSGGPLQDEWDKTRLPVLPLTADDLRAIVVEPAVARSLFFDPDNLPNRIVNEVAGMPGALALLSDTLSTLYMRYLARKTSDRTLSADDYDAVGGVAGLVCARADAVYDALDQVHQETARRVLLRLVAIEGGEPGRRRAARVELDYAERTENARVELVLGRLTEARLVVQDKEPGGAAFVELAHDALVTRWGKLSAWVQEEREALQLQRRLSQAAADWINDRRAAGSLWDKSPLLKQALRTRQRHNWLNSSEREFVAASGRRRVLRRSQLLGTLALLGLLAVIVWGFNLQLTSNNLLASANTALANNSGDEALSLALQAVEQDRTVLPAQLLLSQIAYDRSARWSRNVDPGGVTDVAYSPDGASALSSSKDGTLRLWDVVNGIERVQLKGSSARMSSLAYSPDGASALSGGDDGVVTLWSLERRAEIRRFAGLAGEAMSVAFSPDSRQVLGANSHGDVVLWDLVSGTQLRNYSSFSEVVWSVAFSPDGRRILAGGIEGALIWDAASGMVQHRFGDSRESVRGVAFDPDGKRILTGGDSLVLWDAASGEELRRFEGHTSIIYDVAFSPDGKQVLSGSDDYTLRLWDVATGRQLRIFSGHNASVLGVAFSPNNASLLSGGYEGTLRLWDLAPGAELARLNGHTAAIYGLAVSPDGRTALSTAEDATLRLWDLTARRELRRFAGPADPSWGFAVSTDWQTAFWGDVDGGILQYSLADGRQRRRLTGHSAAVLALAVSPDGSQLLSGSVDGTIRLWDLSSGREIRVLGGQLGSIWGLVFSPDGATALSGGEDKIARRWDLATGQELAQLLGHSGSINSVAFSPDGKQALSVAEDRTVILWDVASGQALRYFVGHTNSINMVAFSADGRQALSVSEDRSLRVWDSASGEELRRFVGTPRGLTGLAVDPNGRFAICGADDGTIQLWRLDTLDELIAWTHANRYLPTQ